MLSFEGWVDKLFVLIFFFNIHFTYFQVATLLCHQVSNNSSISLPLLFTFFLVVLEEILIRSKNRKCNNFDRCIRTCRTQNALGKEVIDSVLDAHKRAFIGDDDGLNRTKAVEGTFLKLDQVSTICSSSFRVQNKWRIQALLTLELSI